jgi:hypothetical protein
MARMDADTTAEMDAALAFARASAIPAPGDALADVQDAGAPA